MRIHESSGLREEPANDDDLYRYLRNPLDAPWPRPDRDHTDDPDDPDPPPPPTEPPST